MSTPAEHDDRWRFGPWAVLLVLVTATVAFLGMILSRMPNAAVVSAGALAALLAIVGVVGARPWGRGRWGGARWATIVLAVVTVVIVVAVMSGLRPAGPLAPVGEGRLIGLAPGIQASVVVTPSVPTEDARSTEEVPDRTADVLLVLINGSDEAFEPGSVSVNVSYDGNEVAQVFDAGGGTQISATEIPAGASLELDLRFAVPPEQIKNLDIEVFVTASDRYPEPYFFAPR